MIKLFTHDDLDGVGCAILAMLAFGDNVEIEYCDHDIINEVVEKQFYDYPGQECHITDISINEDLAAEIDKHGRKYQLLDHHPTALALNKYAWCKVIVEYDHGMKTSGTKLYYNWLIENGHLKKSEVLDRFVEVIRNYDTWRWAELGAEGVICKQVNDLLYLYGRDNFIDWVMEEIDFDIFPYLYPEDRKVLAKKQKEIDEYVEKKNGEMIVAELCGQMCGVVFAEQYFSELGNKLCITHPEVDMIIMIDAGNRSVSYRTAKDDVNVGAIAKNFGGGGHAKAAGSGFSHEIQKKLIDSIFNN